jgi:hypothetical protein
VSNVKILDLSSILKKAGYLYQRTRKNTKELLYIKAELPPAVPTMYDCSKYSFILTDFDNEMANYKNEI